MIKNRDLTIRVMIYALLSEWKKIILWMIIGALCSCLYQYVQGIRVDEKIDEKVNDSATLSLEEAKDCLTESELQSVDETIFHYNELQSTNDYLNHSILMSYEGTSVPYHSFTYAMQLDNAEDYTQEDIELITSRLSSLYRQYFVSGAFARDVEKECDTIPAQYLEELINCTGESVISVVLYLDDSHEKEIEVMQSLLQQKVQEYGEVFAQHELILIDSTSGYVSDVGIVNKKQNYLTAVYNMNNRINNVVASFTENQLVYYNMVTGQESESLEQEGSLQKKGFSIKNLVLGIISGFIIACGIIIVPMILSGRIVSELDYISIFRFKYFGMILGDREKTAKILDKVSMLNKMKYGEGITQNYEDNMSIIALKIKMACSLVQKTKVALLSTCFADISEQIISDLNSRLGKESIEVVQLDKVTKDGQQLQKLFDVGCCFMIEKTGVSQVSNIMEFYEICTENKIDMLGVVDVKN